MVAERVGEARRRFLWNELLAQGAWAMSVAMGAVIVLLILGTQLLDWQWLVLLPAATLGIGTWRTVHRLPSAYGVAQIVDQRLQLADTLSTAFFFTQGTPGDGEVHRAQRAQAERLCETLSIRRAVPYTVPRAVYAFAILGLAASSLFALRYGLDRRLELRKPLARIIQQAFGLDQQQMAALDRKKDIPRKRSNWKEMPGVSVEEGQLPNTGQLDANPATDAPGAPAADQARQAALESAKQVKTAGSEESQGEDSDGSEESAEAGTPGDNTGQQGQGKQNQDSKENAGKQGSPGNDGSNSSLMAKFRDAMQNLLSRMRQQPTGAMGSQMQAARGQNGRQSQTQSGKSQSGKQGQQQSGGEESEGQEGQPGSQSQAAQNATGRGNGQSGEENASKQPGSGIGRQDGDKDVKAAEQLAAMGKISEIIGKRSANVTGEVTVEVQSSHQQLATPYSQRNATHGETTAEISRDEVPVALQAYVQQYFEQVRRQGADSGKVKRAP